MHVLQCLTDVLLYRGVQKFASAYAKTVFLKFYGNHSEGTKHLFETRLQTPMTPTFTFWRRGEPVLAAAWLACPWPHKCGVSNTLLGFHPDTRREQYQDRIGQ